MSQVSVWMAFMAGVVSFLSPCVLLSVRALPTAFLIDRQGQIVKKYLGFKFPDELEKDVAALVEAP